MDFLKLEELLFKMQTEVDKLKEIVDDMEHFLKGSGENHNDRAYNNKRDK